MAFHWIKSLLINRYLSDNKVVRQSKIISLPRAQKIGFLCEITDEDSYKEIFALFSQIQRNNRNLWLMGYIDSKEVPFYCIQQLTADYFSNKELNWYGKPIKVQIFDFANTEFDILIDFTNRSLLPIRSILSLSRAKFIIGANNSNKGYYDLHIDLNTPFSPRTLLENIHIYTQKLTGEL